MTKSSKHSENTSLIEKKSLINYWTQKINEAQSAVNDILEEYDLKPIVPKYIIDDPHTIISIIFNQFHDVADQLTERHDNRDTIKIVDEYDVQDLLHSLLRIFFTDVRAEEHAPSYAGVNPRIDLLLKNEQIIIEVKKTRLGYALRKIRNDLIIDREQYRTHPDCKFLYCFIFDPERRIKNPAPLVNDLSGFAFGYETKVILIH